MLIGIATKWVVDGRAREASDRGYRVIVLEDCCQGITDEGHGHALRLVPPEFATVTTAAAFIRSLTS